MKVKDEMLDALRYTTRAIDTHKQYSSPKEAFADKKAAMERAIFNMEYSMVKEKLPYMVNLAEVDPKLLGILPDPSECQTQVLRFNVARPVDRNFMGEVVSHPEHEALVFEKILVKDASGKIVGLSWQQKGFNPMSLPEYRVKFAKDAFGLSDEEIKELLSVQQG